MRRVIALEDEVFRLRQELAGAKQEAVEAVERTHRQYRRDLVPVQQLTRAVAAGPLKRLQKLDTLTLKFFY